MDRIPAGPTSALGDFMRYPGCRLLLVCAACGWSKAYNPERILTRLQVLKSGGHTTRLEQVAKRVQWPCPACHRLRWRAQFAYPPGLSPAEARRLASRYRN